MKDVMQGWCQIGSVAELCTFCKNKVVEGSRSSSAVLVACEYGQPWFPKARRCHWYTPEEMDE